MRDWVIVVAGVAIGLGVLLNWVRYPRVGLTVFNETSAAIYSVRVSFSTGERLAECIPAGGCASTEIQSYAGSTTYITYRDAAGKLKTDVPVYVSEERWLVDRGSIAVHLTPEGERVVASVYQTDAIPILTVDLSPTGSMTVK
jgi:hypothetical protein